MALLRAGMAELKVGHNNDVLQALGLGSCIGLVIYDWKNHIGGMVHVMLPSSSVSNRSDFPKAKFADTGVPLLLEEVIKAGAVRERLVVKMAGGAEMFAFAGSDAPKLSIGLRNVTAVRQQLADLKLKVKAEDVGGNHGRTLDCDLESLRCTIKVVGKEPKEL